MRDLRRELNGTCLQISDFEYLGRAYKDLIMEVVEKIVDEEGEFRE